MTVNIPSTSGGCKKVCGGTLPNCFHKCKLLCHVTDSSHVNYLCKEKCEKTCRAGRHPCAGECKLYFIYFLTTMSLLQEKLWSRC